MKLIISAIFGVAFGFIAGVALAPSGEVILKDDAAITNAILNGVGMNIDGNSVNVTRIMIVSPGVEWRFKNLFKRNSNVAAINQ